MSRLRSLSVLLALLALLAPAVAGAKHKPITGKKDYRFSRCPKSAKSLVECPDIFYNDYSQTLDFQLEHHVCDKLADETPGTWSFYPGLNFKKGKVNQKYVYTNLVAGNEADPSFYQVTFRIKGKFTSKKRLQLRITGKFTKDNTPDPQCDSAKINEKHVLKIGFQR